MSVSNLILIGGSPRSGTTAILQLFNSNPCVFVTSEENLLNCQNVLKKLLNTKTRRDTVINGTMRELSPRETLTLENIHSHNFHTEAIWPTLRFIYEYHHNQIHPEYDLLIWGDKLPGYWRDLKKIMMIPRAKYIHITRNPLDVINSMLRRTEAAKTGRDWWKNITAFSEMLDVWANAYSSILSVEDKSNVLHVHYEELLFNYENTIDRLNHFLECDLEYENILVADPALHFDRKYLQPNMIDVVKENEIVQKYIEMLSMDKSMSITSSNALAMLIE